jgi:hypothetical protein
VLRITLEFHELCGQFFEVLPLELDCFEALAPSPPQSPAFVVSGEVLTHSSEANFAKKLCGLLSLEVASPGYGKDTACVLVGSVSEDLIRKRGVGRKAFAAV